MSDVRLVNSIGKIVDVNVPIPFVPYDLQARTKELDAFAELLGGNLSSMIGIDVSESITCNCVPNSNTAIASMFIKVPLMEGCPLVQAAKEKNVQYPGLTTGDQASLTSVMQWEKDGQSNWYFLCLIRITFECSVCDGHWISAVLHAPKPLHSFFPMTTDIKNACAMASMPFENDNHALTETPLPIKEAFDKTLVQLGSRSRAVFSNCASYCLAALNNTSCKKDINDLYLEIKRAVRHVYDTAYSILLKGRTVVFTVDEIAEPHQTVYIGGGVIENDNFSIIINGNVFHSVSDFQEGLADAVSSCDWFNDIVKPNIIKIK